MIPIYRVYRSLGKRFRRKRMQLFIRQFAPTSSTRICDIGGTPFNWKFMSVKPWLVFANLRRPAPTLRFSDREAWVIADATRLPFRRDSFDIAFSNSLIEHVGSFENQEKVAAEVRRIAQAYFVQTPNFWFPIEPHWLAPAVHWIQGFLPRRLLFYLLRYGTLKGLLERPSPQEIERILAEFRLLTKDELRRLFPEGRLLVESFFGLPKSLIVLKKVEADSPCSVDAVMDGVGQGS